MDDIMKNIREIMHQAYDDFSHDFYVEADVISFYNLHNNHVVIFDEGCVMEQYESIANCIRGPRFIGDGDGEILRQIDSNILRQIDSNII
jgi:hypothetical protein